MYKEFNNFLKGHDSICHMGIAGLKTVVFVFVLFGLLLSACGGSGGLQAPAPGFDFSNRDLSIPSSRLVGHWKSNTVKGEEKYFSEINPETGEGIYTDYDPDSQAVTVMSYKIGNEDADGEKLIILATTEDGIELPSEEFVLNKDGQNTLMFGHYFSYIDEKTEFDLSELHPDIQPERSDTIYVVIKDTGLYETADADSIMRAVLPVGYRLTPRNGEEEPDCKNVEAGGGMTITSCYMESLSTGQSGWVIKKWMTKEE